MRGVLFAAVGTIFLAASAYAADAPYPSDSPAAPVVQPQTLPPLAPNGTPCIDSTAAMSHVAYVPGQDDAPDASSFCSQYLSTQTLVTAPTEGHT